MRLLFTRKREREVFGPSDCQRSMARSCARDTGLEGSGLLALTTSILTGMATGDAVISVSIGDGLISRAEFNGSIDNHHVEGASDNMPNSSRVRKPFLSASRMSKPAL
jgi:hypothetical protein